MSTTENPSSRVLFQPLATHGFAALFGWGQAQDGTHEGLTKCLVIIDVGTLAIAHVVPLVDSPFCTHPTQRVGEDEAKADDDTKGRHSQGGHVPAVDTIHTIVAMAVSGDIKGHASGPESSFVMLLHASGDVQSFQWHASTFVPRCGGVFPPFTLILTMHVVNRRALSHSAAFSIPLPENASLGKAKGLSVSDDAERALLVTEFGYALLTLPRCSFVFVCVFFWCASYHAARVLGPILTFLIAGFASGTQVSVCCVE